MESVGCLGGKQMSYYSRRYLQEKYDGLKWEMDRLIKREEDKIPEEEVAKVRNAINYYLDAIKKEINK